MSPRGSGTGTANSQHGLKRKLDTNYGTETVEQWASTEVGLHLILFSMS